MQPEPHQHGHFERFAALARTALLLALLTATAPAAASTGEHAVGFAARYAALFHTAEGAQDGHGVGLAFGYRYGVTEFASILADATYAILPVSGEIEHLGFVRCGATYTIDALAWVPWVGIALGAYYVSDVKASFDGGVSVGVGVDYRPRRTFSAGLDVWYHALFQHLEAIPATLTIGVRLNWYFE